MQFLSGFTSRYSHSARHQHGYDCDDKSYDWESTTLSSWCEWIRRDVCDAISISVTAANLPSAVPSKRIGSTPASWGASCVADGEYRDRGVRRKPHCYAAHPGRIFADRDQRDCRSIDAAVLVHPGREVNPSSLPASPSFRLCSGERGFFCGEVLIFYLPFRQSIAARPCRRAGGRC